MTNAETLQVRDEQDTKKLLKSKEGQRFIWRYLSAAGIFRPSFSNDPLVMAYNEGKRNLGLILLAEVMALDPDAYIRMTKMEKEDNDARSQDVEVDPMA
jgi:hypothetical protein